MLLLNIADIHFRHPTCKSPMDPDRPYRTMLINDARDLTEQLGPVDVILVGGDIAFRGAKEEYEAAFEWLRELSSACRCPLGRVFVVPGNHDVDRDVIKGSASVRNVQAAISRAGDKESELRQQFSDTHAGRDLLAPIDAYNIFAAQFDCQLFAPERLFWHQDLQLAPSTVLRIYGLTSTLLSGAGGLDDKPPNLYLSPLQTVLDPENGVVNLVMFHHPPDWFVDGDDVEDALRGRASIQLFGHKHRQRITREHDFIRFSSGAVNPDRHEPRWEPGYNLIQLKVSERDEQRLLDIEAHLRVWQTNPDMFRAKSASQTDNVFRHQLRINGLAQTTHPDARSEKLGVAGPDANRLPQQTSAPPQTEATMSEEKTRNLVLRFWNLASSQRREIALELGLLEDEEIRLPEPERYGRALRRAGKRGLLNKIADEIEKREITNVE